MLKSLIDRVRQHPGIVRKRTIGVMTQSLQEAVDFGDTLADFGEDAAALSDGYGYLLLSAEAMIPDFVQQQPYEAGKAAVIAAVNDVYAVGGRPVGLVNTIGYGPRDRYREVLQGVRHGCTKLRVPMVGGHVVPDAGALALSVAVTGRARKLLRSANVVPGQDLLLLVELEGSAVTCGPLTAWDAHSRKISSVLHARYAVLPQLAEQGLSRTAKDVGSAGLLGTVAQLMELSRCGAEIDLDRVPFPAGVAQDEWLLAYQSLGFVVCTDPAHTPRVQQLAADAGWTTAVIGRSVAGLQVTLHAQGHTDLLFDLEKQDITGITPGDFFAPGG